jgi:hypothetical protein
VDPPYRPLGITSARSLLPLIVGTSILQTYTNCNVWNRLPSSPGKAPGDESGSTPQICFGQRLVADRRWFIHLLIASRIATEPHHVCAGTPQYQPDLLHAACHIFYLRHLTATPPHRTPHRYRPVLSQPIRMISGDETRGQHALVPGTGRSLSTPKLHQDLYGKACRVSLCLDGSLYNSLNSTRQLDMVHKMKLPLAPV